MNMNERNVVVYNHENMFYSYYDYFFYQYSLVICLAGVF